MNILKLFLSFIVGFVVCLLVVTVVTPEHKVKSSSVSVSCDRARTPFKVGDKVIAKDKLISHLISKRDYRDYDNRMHAHVEGIVIAIEDSTLIIEFGYRDIGNYHYSFFKKTNPA